MNLNESLKNLPKVGSLWVHSNGNKYKVIALANTRTERPEQYPVTVVYENILNGAVWCKKASDWNRSMKLDVEKGFTGYRYPPSKRSFTDQHPLFDRL